jgi:hypothetical protein
MIKVSIGHIKYYVLKAIKAVNVMKNRGFSDHMVITSSSLDHLMIRRFYYAN